MTSSHRNATVVVLIESFQFYRFKTTFRLTSSDNYRSSCSATKMNGLTLFLWSLLLCSICATIETLTSSSNAIASHNKNAKYKESSPSSGILSTVAGYKALYEGSTADGILATSEKVEAPRGLVVDEEETR